MLKSILQVTHQYRPDGEGVPLGKLLTRSMTFCLLSNMVPPPYGMPVAVSTRTRSFYSRIRLLSSTGRCGLFHLRSKTEKVDPAPRTLLTSIVLPWARAISCAIARPKPAPCPDRDLSTR